ncbi:MAG: hypothetical protein ICV66_07290 [Chitinophagaceae bacterium]|nr:hypothetical protein [Chitinophagaceae bacterium]
MEKNLDILKLVELATKAPSGHNTQPWCFYTSDNEIQIHPDFGRALPVVDADNHALYISLGCAVENIVIAARKFGYGSDIHLSETSSGTEYISIKFIECEKAEDDDLFDYIEKRQVTRSGYRKEAVSIEHVEKLQNSFSFGTVRIKFFSTPDEIKAIEPFIIEGSNLQFQNRKFIDELVSWFRFSRKEAEEKGDGLWTSCMGLPKMNRFIGNLVMKYFVSQKSESKRWRKLIQSSPGFAMFIVPENTVANWVTLGQAFQRFGLTATKLNICHAHVNMPCEELSIRRKMIEQFHLETSQPLLLIRFGYGEKLPYSFRRPVADVLVNRTKHYHTEKQHMHR